MQAAAVLHWKSLRRQVRVAAGRSHTPHTASTDSQTVKATETADSRGYDGAKKITGRKRHIAVDSLGLLLVVAVTTADVADAVAAKQVLAQLTVCPLGWQVWDTGCWN